MCEPYWCIYISPVALFGREIYVVLLCGKHAVDLSQKHFLLLFFKECKTLEIHKYIPSLTKVGSYKKEHFNGKTKQNTPLDILLLCRRLYFTSNYGSPHRAVIDYLSECKIRSVSFIQNSSRSTGLLPVISIQFWINRRYP